MIRIEILIPQENNLEEEIRKKEELKIEYVESTITKELLGLSPHELVEIGVSLASNISIGLLTNLIYDLCKNKAKKIWIQDEEIELEKDKIEEKLIEATEGKKNEEKENLPPT